MNEKIVEMICELARQGGSAALWMYTLYIVGGVLKFAIGFGTILIGLLKFANVVKGFQNDSESKD